jgi:tRNA (adenine37-N6)-methyltransferase
MHDARSSKIFVSFLLCGVATTSILCYHLLKRYRSLQAQIQEYESQIQKEKDLRSIERKGRTTSQKKKREEIQKEQSTNGYTFTTIGVIESPFPDRRGTPRQPNLVRAATARIRFDKKKIQHEHFKELEQFSHLWILWVFHENTNSDSSNIAAKIKPPRLHGARVGCLSTRSPHRPNPIGLSVSEIVGVGSDYIDIICVDMIDGTPVLDGRASLTFTLNLSVSPCSETIYPL